MPLVHIVEQPVSEDKCHSDNSGSSQEDSDELTTDEGTDEEMDDNAEDEDWSEEITCRDDVDFRELVGINVDGETLESCLDFFSFWFTKEVWKLLIDQTNLYAEQNRGPAENCLVSSQNRSNEGLA